MASRGHDKTALGPAQRAACRYRQSGARTRSLAPVAKESSPRVAVTERAPQSARGPGLDRQVRSQTRLEHQPGLLGCPPSRRREELGPGSANGVEIGHLRPSRGLRRGLGTSEA